MDILFQLYHHGEKTTLQTVIFKKMKYQKQRLLCGDCVGDEQKLQSTWLQGRWNQLWFVGFKYSELGALSGSEVSKNPEWMPRFQDWYQAGLFGNFWRFFARKLSSTNAIFDPTLPISWLLPIKAAVPRLLREGRCAVQLPLRRRTRRRPRRSDSWWRHVRETQQGLVTSDPFDLGDEARGQLGTCAKIGAGWI